MYTNRIATGGGVGAWAYKICNFSLIVSGPDFAIHGLGIYGRNFRSPSRP